MKNILRDYQVKARDEIRGHFAKGTKKVLLHLATGGGKTTVFSDILNGVVQKNKKAIMVVRGRQLVQQASERLFRDSVPHGVLMANHWNKNTKAPVQACSIDTLNARKTYPEADLVVIDEGHLFTSESCNEFVEHYASKGAFILPVTATPWTREPLRHMADTVVHPISVLELMEQGYLVRPKYYAPSAPDLKGVMQGVDGDYIKSQLNDRMSPLTGDIVSHWRNLGQGRPTICFAVSIEHSLSIVAAFNAAGISAEHIEGDHSFSERAAAIGRLNRGEIKILSNVGVLCTGVDIPKIGCIINARPTKSFNLYIQQMGRGTRPCYADGHDTSTIEGRLEAIAASEKPNFIILDHAGNTTKFGFITNEPEVDLDGLKKKVLDTGPKPKLCKTCYLQYTESFCPTCGPVEKEDDGLIIQHEDGQLVELKDMPFAAEIVQFVTQLKETRKRKGYKKGWVYWQVKNRYGEEIANELFPNNNKGFTKDGPPGFRRGSLGT